MKKVFATFCALSLLTTQLPTANAAELSEKSKSESILEVANNIQIDQFEGFYHKTMDQVSLNRGENIQEFNSLLAITKNSLDKLLVDLLQEVSNNAQVKTTNPITEAKPVEEKAVNENNTQKESNEVVQQPTTPVIPNEKKQPVENKEINNPTQPTKVPEYQQPTTNQTQQNTKQPVQQQPQQKPSTPVQSVSEFERQVVELTNVERSKVGLARLTIHAPLMNVAEEKSLDMSRNNYFSHNSPTLGSPFDQMKAAGIQYRAAGENIAQGQRTPEQVVQAWMQSPGHRQNILNPNFTHIGVGFVEDGYYWTQQFITL